MNSKPIVFLDTSIQIERILGKRKRKIEIEQQLTNGSIQFVSSHYVFMEFQRSVIADHIHIYNKMLECDDWQELVTELHTGTRRYRPRSLMRSMQIFTQIMVVGQMKRELALTFLKIQIEQGLSTNFWHRVKPISDSIFCDLIEKGVTLQKAGNFWVADSCRKESATCYLPNFLNSNHSKVQAIRDYLITHPKSIKDQERVERLLDIAIENPQAILGQSSCWPLGDIVIALQVPPKGQLWTIDKDFGPLMGVIGVGLYNP